MLTTEQVTAAINEAGFEDAEAFAQFLTIANLVLRRDGMTAAIAAAQAARSAHNAQVEATIQGYQAEYDAIQSQIIALVTGQAEPE